MKINKDEATASLEQERDDLRKELIGTQEMLAFVLQSVGEPVTVTKEQIAAGLGSSAQIQVDDDLEGECFVFSLIGE